jgi:hypothetical protein
MLTTWSNARTRLTIYLLGFIAGLCNQEPRDELLLDDMLLYSREAQEAQRQSPNFAG